MGFLLNFHHVEFRELVLGNRVKVQSLNTKEYYIVPVEDVYLVQGELF